MSTDMVSIAELADVNPRTDVKGLAPDTLVSFIPMADVTETGQWIRHQERHLRDVRIGYTPFTEGDVLFAKITPCMENGKGAHVKGLKNGVGFGSTEFHVLRTRNGNDPRFLFHWLQAKPTRLRAIAFMGGSAGQQRVQQDFFINYRVPAIESADQARIAYVLDTIDAAIAKTEAVITKLKQVRAGMLHDLLSYGLDENGHLRDPIAHPEQFKDSPLGRIPRKWDVVKLDEALSMQAGNILNSEHIAENGQYPVYGGNGIRGYTSTFTHDGLFALIGRQGALCGNIIIASGKFYATEHAVVVTAKEQMNAGWLASYLTTMNLNRFSESSAQPGLSVQKISHHRIKLPKFPEQEAIDLYLKAIDEQMTSELNEVQKYRSIKSGLQDDLLTGRVRVPETIMEGAAVA